MKLWRRSDLGVKVRQKWPTAPLLYDRMKICNFKSYWIKIKCISLLSFYVRIWSGKSRCRLLRACHVSDQCDHHHHCKQMDGRSSDSAAAPTLHMTTVQVLRVFICWEESKELRFIKLAMTCTWHGEIFHPEWKKTFIVWEIFLALVQYQ